PILDRVVRSRRGEREALRLRGRPIAGAGARRAGCVGGVGGVGGVRPAGKPASRQRRRVNPPKGCSPAGELRSGLPDALPSRRFIHQSAILALPSGTPVALL